MKFLIKKYKDFELILKKKGFVKDEYSSTKSKGHLYVKVRDYKSSFSFFRKKESSINNNGQFLVRTTYYINGNKNVSYENWNEVLKAFLTYLDK
ncbi:MAG: hypothetical protein MK078_16510 [Crocinitomicaceae bacterium]|nr:hypothetical protein [Crocinitomicaceae bacterium]